MERAPPEESSGLATNANATAAQIGRPLNALYPYLSYIYTVQNLNHSNYDGLQTVLTQRPARGLSYTLGYTFSHALDQVLRRARRSHWNAVRFPA